MSRLPTIDDCLECRPRECQQGETSVFWGLGPRTCHDGRVRRPSGDDLEPEEEDKYHHPRWCPDGLSRSQKRKVQRLRNLEEAEAKYLDVLRKARPDLAEQVRHPQRVERRPPRREWRPKQQRADEKPSADVNMVFMLPSEFRAPQPEELAIAQGEKLQAPEGIVSQGLHRWQTCEQNVGRHWRCSQFDAVLSAALIGSFYC